MKPPVRGILVEALSCQGIDKWERFTGGVDLVVFEEDRPVAGDRLAMGAGWDGSQAMVTGISESGHDEPHAMQTEILCSLDRNGDFLRISRGYSSSSPGARDGHRLRFPSGFGLLTAIVFLGKEILWLR